MVLGCDYAARYIGGMDIPSVLKQLLDDGLTQAELAAALKTNQPTVSRWMRGEREPMGKSMERIRALAVRHRIAGIEPEGRRSIPIMGFIGAGAEIEPEYESIPVDGLEQVELPLRLDDDVIGFEVQGDSMLPTYDAGTVVVVYRDKGVATSSLLGDVVALLTADGKRYLKRLMPGSKPHLYTLESSNARPITGARIVWASEIVAIIPPRQVRKLSKPVKQGKSAARSQRGATRGNDR